MNTFKTMTDFDEILDSCLARMRSGEALERCLDDYPEWAGELRPLLQAAAVIHTTSRPAARTQAVSKGQAAMLAALANRDTEGIGRTAVSFGALRRYAERLMSVLKTEETSNMKPALRSIFTTIFVVFISGFFALAISANSLPGEPFYPLKLGWESARLGLTFDPDARAQFEGQIQQNRQGELVALIELGRQTQIVYEGILEEIGEEQIVVDGFVFEFNDKTQLLVKLAVGEAVRIETEIDADGRLTALEISAGSLPERPQAIVTATPTPCNNPTCSPPTATPTPCNGGACGSPSPTPPPTATSNTLTPTPCNTPTCGQPTATPTVCTAGACNPSPTPPPSSTPNAPTPTPCNTPACSTPNATPTICNAGACGSSTPPPPATSTPNVPTPTPCNAPACAPTPTPCNTGSCGDPTPPPTSTPNVPPPSATPTPCNSPACSTPQPTPTCNAGACGGSPTPPPPPTSTPNNPSPSPCNTPACGTPNPTPTVCNGGACGGFTEIADPN